MPMVFRILLFTTLVPLAACSEPPPSAPAAPAKLETVAHESELLRLTLTPQAQQRLGIRTERIGQGSIATRRLTSGEIVAPNAAGGVPTGSLSTLAQIGSQQATADGEVTRTRAQARLARIALDRASALVREEAGSVRSRDEAAAALATAQAQADVAIAQRRLLGPAIALLDRQATVWVRVPVFGTDVAGLERRAGATVAPLGAAEMSRAARPVQAPPSGNAATGTVDLYFALDNRDRAYRIGQRVSVAALPCSTAQPPVPSGGGGGHRPYGKAGRCV